MLGEGSTPPRPRSASGTRARPSSAGSTADVRRPAAPGRGRAQGRSSADELAAPSRPRWKHPGGATNSRCVSPPSPWTWISHGLSGRASVRHAAGDVTDARNAPFRQTRNTLWGLVIHHDLFQFTRPHARTSWHATERRAQEGLCLRAQGMALDVIDPVRPYLALRIAGHRLSIKSAILKIWPRMSRASS